MRLDIGLSALAVFIRELTADFGEVGQCSRNEAATISISYRREAGQYWSEPWVLRTIFMVSPEICAEYRARLDAPT